MIIIVDRKTEVNSKLSNTDTHLLCFSIDNLISSQIITASKNIISPHSISLDVYTWLQLRN